MPCYERPSRAALGGLSDMAVYAGMLLFTDNTSISMSTVASCFPQQKKLCERTGRRAAASPAGSGGQYRTDVLQLAV